MDGAACDRLADAGGGVMGTLAGAMRAGQQIVPLATPGKDISSYEVTPGMIRMIARNTKTDVSGVWVSTDVAKDFGLTKGSVMQTEQGTMSVAGVFDWRLRSPCACIRVEWHVRRMLGQTVAAKRADGGCVVFHAGCVGFVIQCWRDAGE